MYFGTVAHVLDRNPDLGKTLGKSLLIKNKMSALFIYNKDYQYNPIEDTTQQL